MTESTLSQEKADRQLHRAAIERLFKANPLAEIEPAELKAITPHYQQRISELRKRPYLMTIQNVPRSRQDAAGRVIKQDGAYRYQPFGSTLGPDAGVPARAQGWSSKHSRPFEEDFRLK